MTKIDETVCGDGRMSIRMIAETVNSDKGTVRKILRSKLNMKKLSAKLVPKTLTSYQKLVHQQICSNFHERLDEELELIENIVICDEIWIFQYDVATKWQSMRWKTPASPRMKKIRILKLNLHQRHRDD